MKAEENEPLSQSQMIELLINPIKRLEYLIEYEDKKDDKPFRVEIYHQQSPVQGDDVFKQLDELKLQNDRKLWDKLNSIEKKLDDIIAEIDSIKTKIDK